MDPAVGLPPIALYTTLLPGGLIAVVPLSVLTSVQTGKHMMVVGLRDLRGLVGRKLTGGMKHHPVCAEREEPQSTARYSEATASREGSLRGVHRAWRRLGRETKAQPCQNPACPGLPAVATSPSVFPQFPEIIACGSAHSLTSDQPKDC